MTDIFLICLEVFSFPQKISNQVLKFVSEVSAHAQTVSLLQPLLLPPFARYHDRPHRLLRDPYLGMLSLPWHRWWDCVTWDAIEHWRVFLENNSQWHDSCSVKPIYFEYNVYHQPLVVKLRWQQNLGIAEVIELSSNRPRWTMFLVHCHMTPMSCLL